MFNGTPFPITVIKLGANLEGTFFVRNTNMC
jgi:hypothetical protein